MATGTALTFERLDAQVDSYVEATSDEPSGLVERASLAIGLLAAGLGSLLATMIGGHAGLAIIQVSLIVELAGLGLSIGLQIRRNWRSFRHSRRAYAIELDHDYVEFLRFVEWLRTFPASELEIKLRYIRTRKNTMAYRIGLLTGGIERLGVLPVLGALYVQFRGWEFGDWGALDEVNLVGGLLLWALLLIYAGGWYLIRLRSRLDAYEALLGEAVVPKAT